MEKSTFATIGILAVLLLSLGLVSAAIEGITITIKTPLPTNVAPGTSHNVEVSVENFNGTTIKLEWVNTSSSFDTIWTSLEDNSTLADSNSADFSATLSIPSDYTGSHGRYLKANVYDSATGDFLGTIQKSFKANSTVPDPEVSGCTDPSANNYDSDATVDDGSCTYDTTDPILGCTDPSALNYVPTATPNNANSEVCTFDATTTSYCNDGDAFAGEQGTLEIKNFYIDYIGSGDDEEWEALDEIILEVDVKNTDSSDRVDDIIVEIKILDSNNKDVTSDFEFEDEDQDIGRISKKTTETATFTIKELPTDVEEGTYRIYVRAYDEEDEDLQCASISDDFNDETKLFHEFEVIREDEAVIVKDSDLFSETISASCGDKNVEVSFEVYNLGDEEEDKVLVQIYNRELNIDQFYVIDSLRSGKGKTATFFINLPEELSKTKYELDIYIFFAYDEDEDEWERSSYDENSNDIDRDFSININIESCQGPKPTISASLDSEAKVGEELVVIATVINNGEDGTFDISISGYENWAELVSVSPQFLSLDEDEEGTVTITLIPTKDGTQTLDIDVFSDGESYDQAVSVSITEKKGLFEEVSKTVLYGVAGVSLLLILIFLTLIVKVSRRSKKVPQF